MKNLRIYLDTSVLNFIFAEDAPDFQKATVEFFEHYSMYYDLYISDIVILEIQNIPDIEYKNKLLSLIDKYQINMLSSEYDKEIKELAEKYIEKGIIPKRKMADALHIAYATLFEMDILLSWNFKHLANINKETRITLVNIENGFRYPLKLASPLEVLYEE